MSRARIVGAAIGAILCAGCPNNFGNPWSSIPDPSAGGDGDAVSRACSETHLIAGTAPGDQGLGGVTIARGSTLFLGVSATDCGGRAFTGLDAADFELEEDGAPSSAESTLRVRAGHVAPPMVHLLFDVSSSTTPVLSELKAGAKALVKKLLVDEQVPAVISILTFAGYSKMGVEDLGERGLVTNVATSSDRATLEDAIDHLVDRSSYPRDLDSTALYGATLGDLEALREAREADLRSQAAGGLRAGYVVVFTDGADTAGTVALSQVEDGYSKGTERILGVALAGADYTATARDALSRLAPDGVFEATQPDGLSDAYDRIGARIAGEFRGSYVLSYCTPVRASSHQLRIGIKGAGSMPARAHFEFNASGFVESSACYSDTVEARCENKLCGALCGICSSDGSATCESFRCNRPNTGMPVNGVCDPSRPLLCGGSCLPRSNEDCAACGISCSGDMWCDGTKCRAPAVQVTVGTVTDGVRLMGIDGGYVYVSVTDNPSSWDHVRIFRVPTAGGTPELLFDAGKDQCIWPTVSAGTIYCIGTASAPQWKLRSLVPVSMKDSTQLMLTDLRDWPAGLSYWAAGNIYESGMIFGVQDGEVLLGQYIQPSLPTASGRYLIRVGRMPTTGTAEPRYVFREESGVDWMGEQIDISLLGASFGAGGDTVVTYERLEHWGSMTANLVDGVSTTITAAQGEVSGLAKLSLVRAPSRPDALTLDGADAQQLFVKTFGGGATLVLARDTGLELGRTFSGMRSVSPYYQLDEPWSSRVVGGNTVAIRSANGTIFIGAYP